MPFPEGDPADGNARKPGHLGLPGLGLDVSIIDAVIMEVLMMFFLVMVIFGTVVEPRGPEAIAPLAIGLTITMDILGAALPGRRLMQPVPSDRPSCSRTSPTGGSTGDCLPPVRTRRSGSKSVRPVSPSGAQLRKRGVSPQGAHRFARGAG